MKRLRNNSFATAFALFTLLGVFSCKTTIDIDPQDQIDSELALTSSAGVTASIAAVYATLKTEPFYGNRLIGLGDAMSDNAMSSGKSGRYVNESRNIAGIANSFTNWTASYVALNRINIVLAGIPGISDASAAQKDLWEGELKFLRALYHFDLVRTYSYIPGALVPALNKGGVPVILSAINTADAAINANTPRVPIDDVYTAIYADLDVAVAKLANIGTSPAVANKQAAQALYSRVALYKKDWAKVISMSGDVITSRGSTLATPSTFMKSWTDLSNPECLFEVKYLIESEGLGVNFGLQTVTNTLLARQPVLKRDSSEVYDGRKATDKKLDKQAGWGDLVPTNDLLNALGITIATVPATGATTNGTNNVLITSRSADVRNALFEVGSNLRGTPYIECTKYLGKAGWVNVDNVPVLRIAEMYLNRAEANYESGNTAAALTDVNTIRTNRGLAAASGLTGTALLNEILLQRRLEFAFEGQRFFDLKRRGSNINKPASNTTVSFDNYAILPMIPPGDVDASKGTIPQNSGY